MLGKSGAAALMRHTADSLASELPFPSIAGPLPDGWAAEGAFSSLTDLGSGSTAGQRRRQGRITGLRQLQPLLRPILLNF